MTINIMQYLQHSAKKFPRKIAFRDKNRSITFFDLDKQSRELAKHIISATDNTTKLPIAVYLSKGVDCIVCFMAAAYSGNYYTPLDITMPRARLEKLLVTLQPAVILTDTANSSSVSTFNSDATIINIEELAPSLITDQLLQSNVDKVIDTDPLYVLFTSGSTGVPKGVVISHRSVIDYTEWLAETFSFSASTVFGNQAPFYFDNSILDIYSTLRNGSEMVIIPEEKFLAPIELLRYLDENNVDTIFWVPSALVLVSNSGALNKYIPKNLKTVMFCGEVMPNKQLNDWRLHLPDAVYANLYGPTEITDVCTYYIVNRDFSDDEPLPIGMPCRNTDIILLNENNERVIGSGIGELCVRGTSLSMGYYCNDEKTQDVFIQNPLNKNFPEKIYRTGDLVRYNDYGELMYICRKDYQIKHMGHRIELGEIESASYSYDGLSASCAIYDEKRKRIVLFCSPEQLDKKSIYLHLKERLPHYMLPSLIVTMQDLPLNANGKIDRRFLCESL